MPKVRPSKVRSVFVIFITARVFFIVHLAKLASVATDGTIPTTYDVVLVGWLPALWGSVQFQMQQASLQLASRRQNHSRLSSPKNHSGISHTAKAAHFGSSHYNPVIPPNRSSMTVQLQLRAVPTYLIIRRF